MTRDLDFYNDPEEFLPERHLDMRSGVMRRDKEMPSSYTFGFGRRYVYTIFPVMPVSCNFSTVG